jgi:hypothetical protein
MTDDLIIAIVLGTLGVAAVVHGGLDGFGPIAGTFGVAIVVRRLVAWRARRAQFPRAKVTSRSEDRAPRRDSAAD